MANRARKVVQCDLSGNELRVFSSCKEAAFSIGSQGPTHIHKSIQYGRPAYGYRWKYVGEPLKPIPSGTPGKRRSVIALNLKTGKETIFPSISQASRSLSIGLTAIESSLQTGSRSKGYRFCYEGEDFITPSRKHTFKRPVLALDDSGIVIKEYESVYAAAKDLKVTKGAIYWCLSSNRPNDKCRGFRWRYKGQE